MRLVVISDPLESGRQIHSDGGDFLRGVVSHHAHLGDVRLVSPTEDEVADELDALDPSETAAVIFETNSLRHPDSIVARAVRDRARKLSEYLAGGGGVLVLHQYVLDRPVLELETDTVAFRAHEGAVLPLRTDRVRSVLEVPHRIDESSRPPSAESSQIGRLVSWLALDSEQLAGCDIVLRSAQGLPLLAVSSTEIEGRLAVSALPLDWHRWGDLLANAVRYVALGDPRVLVWGEDDDYEPTIERALASGIALRARRDPATGVDRLSPAPVLHIDVPGSHSMPTGTRSTVLSRGATVLAPSARDRARHNTVSYTVHIGSAGYRYAQAALSTLAAADDDLIRTRDPYLLRNVTLASEYFAGRYWPPHVHRRPSEDPRFISDTARTVHFAGMTTTSALVSLQTHFLLRPGEPAVEQLFRLIEEQDPRDEAGGGIHVGAARVLRGDLDAWEWLHSIVQRPRMPLSKLSRMADWVAYLEANDRIARVDDQTVLDDGTPDPRPGTLRQLTSMFGRALTERGEAEHLSHEAKANLVLGFCALRTLGCSEADALIHRFVPALETWAREHHDVSHVSARLRVLHALARAEDVSPSGVHGIRALDQISAPIARDVPTDHGAGETLAARNKKLLDTIAEMEASADRRRLAYLVGVTCSAIVAVLAPGALAALCITLIAPSSFSELLIPALIACVLLFVVIVTQFQRLGLLPLANDGAAGRAIRALRSRFWPTSGS